MERYLGTRRIITPLDGFRISIKTPSHSRPKVNLRPGVSSSRKRYQYLPVYPVQMSYSVLERGGGGGVLLGESADLAVRALEAGK